MQGIFHLIEQVLILRCVIDDRPRDCVIRCTLCLKTSFMVVIIGNKFCGEGVISPLVDGTAVGQVRILPGSITRRLRVNVIAPNLPASPGLSVVDSVERCLNVRDV